MKKIKWKKSKKPDVKCRIVQYDLIEIEKENNYYNIIGSIFTWSSKKNEWLYTYDDKTHYLEAKNLKNAKKEFQEIYKEICKKEIEDISNALKIQKARLILLNKLENKGQPMTRDEYEMRVQEIYDKHGITVKPIRTMQELIDAPNAQGIVNYNPDEKIPEIK